MLAVFFDANGVLYHREGQHRHLRSFLTRHALPQLTSEDVWHIKDAIRSRPAHKNVSRIRAYDALLTACGVVKPALIEAGRQALAADSRAITLFDGVPSTLKQLQSRGFKLGVITNTRATTAEKLAWLNEQQLDLRWDAFVSSCEVGVRKPQPAIYHLALNQANVSPADAVFVGHAADELMGARATGMYPVAFNPDSDVFGEVVVPTFSGLLTLLMLASPAQSQ